MNIFYSKIFSIQKFYTATRERAMDRREPAALMAIIPYWLVIKRILLISTYFLLSK